jgi:hypothetical protein
VGMLGGGNRGRGVGNEPSRSLRGSGVVARLLRSELSAEHFSLSRAGSRLERYCSSVEAQRDRAQENYREGVVTPRAIRRAVETRAGLVRTVGAFKGLRVVVDEFSRTQEQSEAVSFS